MNIHAIAGRLVTLFSVGTTIAGLLGGAILIYNGEWSNLFQGIIGSAVGGFVLMIAMLPAGLLMAPAAAFEEAGKSVLRQIFTMLSTFYLGAVFGLWCFSVLFYLMGNSETFFGSLLFGWAVALGPIIYISERGIDASDPGSMITARLNNLNVQLSFFIALFLGFFFGGGFWDLVIVYAVGMIVFGLATQRITRGIYE